MYTIKQFKIIINCCRNRIKRFCFRFKLITRMYNFEANWVTQEVYYKKTNIFMRNNLLRCIISTNKDNLNIGSKLTS